MEDGWFFISKMCVAFWALHGVGGHAKKQLAAVRAPPEHCGDGDTQYGEDDANQKLIEGDKNKTANHDGSAGLSPLLTVHKSLQPFKKHGN